MTKIHRKRHLVKTKGAANGIVRSFDGAQRTVAIKGPRAIVETVLADGERVTFEIPVGSLDLPESSAARAAAAAG